MITTGNITKPREYEYTRSLNKVFSFWSPSQNDYVIVIEENIVAACAIMKERHTSGIDKADDYILGSSMDCIKGRACVTTILDLNALNNNKEWINSIINDIS